jgi:tetraacyldisaccharide-1-P 4'-kinase
LTTGIARPDRVVAMLRAQGIRLESILYSADHAPIRMTRTIAASERRRHTNVDLWVTTPKDFARAEHCENVGVLDYYLDLPSSLTGKLRSRFSLHF